MDSISTFLVWLSIGLTIKAGNEPLMFFLTTIMGMVLFYMSHWVSYVIGHLKFSKFDVVEIQYVAISTFVITGVFGPEIWDMGVYDDYNLRHIYYMLSFVCAVNAGLTYCYQILEGKLIKMNFEIKFIFVRKCIFEVHTLTTLSQENNENCEEFI
jgi:hypothetical protein